MISVAEARRRILDPLAPTGVETVGLADALGRVLAEEVRARVTQPPVAVSAMDGYAVRADDVARTPATLRRVGEAPAGSAYDGVVGPGEAVRIFTGGPVPRGADTIVVQEEADADGERIVVKAGRSYAPRGAPALTPTANASSSRRARRGERTSGPPASTSAKATPARGPDAFWAPGTSRWRRR